MTAKISTETVAPQKSIGDNLNYSFAYNYDENYANHKIIDMHKSLYRDA